MRPLRDDCRSRAVRGQHLRSAGRGPAVGAAPALPAPASKLVARMLAKDPAWRLQSMVQVRSEIAKVIRRARAQAGVGGLADLRRRWESFWEERMAPWFPPRARPVARWMGSLLSSRRRVVGLGVGWVVTVSLVAVVALRERGAPAQSSLAATKTSTVRAVSEGSRPGGVHFQVSQTKRGPSAVVDGVRPVEHRVVAPAKPEDRPEVGGARGAQAAPALVSAAPPLARATDEPDLGEGVGSETEEEAPPPATVGRSASRARAAKASSNVRSGMAAARASRAETVVELTDDQRKL